MFSPGAFPQVPGYMSIRLNKSQTLDCFRNSFLQPARLCIEILKDCYQIIITSSLHDPFLEMCLSHLMHK